MSEDRASTAHRRPRRHRRAEIGAVYAAGLLQGLALVTFPAASAVFTEPRRLRADERPSTA